MDARQTIGWNIRRLRGQHDLSQERLALAANIDRSYLGRVERGSENVTIAVLIAIAMVLEVPVADLLVEPAEGAPAPAPLRPGRKPKSKERS